MNLSQEMLRHELEHRVRRLRPDLASRLDAADLTAQRWSDLLAEPLPGTDLSSVVILRSFDLGSWIRETFAFAARVPPEQAAAWRRSFTRTIFLAGNPDNLRDRFRLEHVAADGSAAWFGPAPDPVTTPLRRLLKLFTGDRPVPPGPPLLVRLPAAAGPDPAARRTAAPARRDLYLATAGTTVAHCLVTLNHLLVEAVFDGLLVGEEQLRVLRVPRLIGVRGEAAALRVGVDQTDPVRLQAHACLTEEISDDAIQPGTDRQRRARGPAGIPRIEAGG